MIIEYLNYSKEKRKNITKIANNFFEQIIKEERRNERRRRYSNSRENDYSIRIKGVVLEPIKERTSRSRALINRNKTELL